MTPSFDLAWDVECYPNVFTLCAEHADYPLTWCFEISPWRNDYLAIVEWVVWLRSQKARMVGFNNVGFDYPILHELLKNPHTTAATLYAKCQDIIQSQDFDKWQHMVYPSDRYIEQIDLYKIHHFDNKARATGLKALEFNMRLDNVSDLPFPVGTVLNQEQTQVLKQYNAHDVRATKKFHHASKELIAFREGLTEQYEKDFMNFADVKIGKEIFAHELEKKGVQLYKYGSNGRQPMQTLRTSIALKDCILPWIEFENVGFRRVLDWFRQQTISETKGVFTDLTVDTYGLTFVFGTGGLHAAVKNKAIVATDDKLIESRDVSSYYPNLSIVNNFYPEHLGEKFCTVYKTLYERRKGFKKGTVENAALKLSLNGTYGASNDKFSVFYDPSFTLKITLNGQLLLCLLIEQLCKIPTVEMIMVNTDGLEYTIHPDHAGASDKVCDAWCKTTGLVLESARYSKMFIRDCNNYIAVYED